MRQPKASARRHRSSSAPQPAKVSVSRPPSARSASRRRNRAGAGGGRQRPAAPASRCSRRPRRCLSAGAAVGERGQLALARPGGDGGGARLGARRRAAAAAASRAWPRRRLRTSTMSPSDSAERRGEVAGQAERPAAGAGSARRVGCGRTSRRRASRCADPRRHRRRPAPATPSGSVRSSAARQASRPAARRLHRNQHRWPRPRPRGRTHCRSGAFPLCLRSGSSARKRSPYSSVRRRASSGSRITVGVTRMTTSLRGCPSRNCVPNRRADHGIRLRPGHRTAVAFGDQAGEQHRLAALDRRFGDPGCGC